MINGLIRGGYGGIASNFFGEASFPKPFPFSSMFRTSIELGRFGLSIASIWSNESWVILDDFFSARAAGVGDFGAEN